MPLWIGIGQIMKFGHQSVNLQAGVYCNVDRPDYASRWQVRLQVQFLFPKCRNDLFVTPIGFERTQLRDCASRSSSVNKEAR